MSLGVNIYSYDDNGNYTDITDLITELKYACSLDKISQELNITMAYGIYSTSFPSFYIGTGQKIEVYKNKQCIFKGKVETSTIQAEKESLRLVCYDYIRNLTKSKIVDNFSNVSAFDAVCKIFNDLEIPYSKDGILGGTSGEGSKITINHLIKNKSAYDACMMIATEVYRSFGTSYYMFMDIAGNVNLMACDKYWSSQTIMPCSNPNLSNPDGNIISFSYKEDASDIITRVQLFDSKGNPVDIETGKSNESESEK